MTRPPVALLTDPLVSVVMPAFNERDTIEEIVRRGMAVPLRLELIVIDDCSTDGTWMTWPPRSSGACATVWTITSPSG